MTFDPPVTLVDFDGTIVDIRANWAIARLHAASSGLPPSVRGALISDRDGEFWQWMDQFESAAPLVAIHSQLLNWLEHRIWAIVSDNGRSVINLAIGSGIIPSPTVIAAREFGHPLKPSPDVALRALTAIGIAPRRDIFLIGDTERDELTATAAGLSFSNPAQFTARVLHL